MATAVPTRADFMRDHPRLAATKPDSAERRAWLAAHPSIAAQWERVRTIERYLVSTYGADWDTKGERSYRMWAAGNVWYTQQASGGGAPAAGGGTAAPAAGAVVQAAPAPPARDAAADASAKAVIVGALSTFGLGALGEWAWDRYLNGVPTSQIFLDLRARPEYRARFPGMAEMEARGQAISEQEYINLESTYRSVFRSYGVPASFYDGPEDFGRYIAGGKSPQELAEQLDMAEQVAATDPRGVTLRNELARLYQVQGLDVPANIQGAVTAWFIDPDKAQPLIERQFRSVVTAAASQRAGYGALTTAEAEEIAGYGATEEQAVGVFGQLSTMGEFLVDLPGGGDDNITRRDQLKAGFAGDAAAQQRIERTRRRRQAAFQGGGGYAAGERGVSGLGTATR